MVAFIKNITSDIEELDEPSLYSSILDNKSKPFRKFVLSTRNSYISIGLPSLSDCLEILCNSSDLEELTLNFHLHKYNGQNLPHQNHQIALAHRQNRAMSQTLQGSIQNPFLINSSRPIPIQHQENRQSNTFVTQPPRQILFTNSGPTKLDLCH
ncbi:18484_t:CDS:2 [Dentiscutata erythropus]|uniref:18484_t:CDS:1 n=1 Tax=Dentiscutata erythropus TaxID=1348616 RepID=A0A9N9GA49_9GLOM|nr:18484_t:CDS:2 [Dentiscutata erythropus]